MRDEAEAAPFEVGTELHDLANECQGVRIALPGHNARVLIFDLGAPFRELAQDHRDGLKDIEWLEAGNHKRLSVLLRNKLVGLAANHRRDMTWTDKAVEPKVR